MMTNFEAAALHGLATNASISPEDRLKCALRALELYESEVDSLRERLRVYEGE